MARQIKWRLQFKSLNNTGCLVNIYEDGYTGSSADTTKTGADVPFTVESGVTALQGAANPFEYQEDASKNLLDFVRIKTGYIRVIEETYGALNNLYPTSIRQHFVEAFYGAERVFTGFMQCQQFDNDWVSEPRELEFPIISPLGLLDAFKFSVPSTYGLETLGSLMNYLMATLNPSADGTTTDYSDVIYPVESATPGNPTYTPWDQVISSVVMCPFNESFKHYDDPTTIYAPRELKYFIDGICACFGWIVHDTPSSIVFAKYDYVTYGYSRLTYAGLASLNSGLTWVQQRAAALNSYYTNADKNAVQSMVMPLKKITLSLSGNEISQKQLSTKQTYLTNSDSMSGGGNYRGVALRPNGSDVDGQSIDQATFDSNGNIYDPGLFPVAYGKIAQGDTSVSLSESWYVKFTSSWGEGTPLIKAKFFGAPPTSADYYCMLKLVMERGSDMQSLQSSGYGNIPLGLVIKIDGKYYDAHNETLYDQTTPIINSIIINGQTGKITPNKAFDNPSLGLPNDICDIDGWMFKIGYAMARTIEVWLVVGHDAPLHDGHIIKITEMSLNNPGRVDEAYNDYYEYLDDEIEIDGNSTGTDSEEITVNFNNYSMSRGDHAFGVKDYWPSADYPTFPYMFKPLTVLTQKVRKTTSPDFNEYAALWTYWINGWRWRMVAKDFCLIDDRYTITIARSQTLG